ncbi:DarT ssDNA thymidine ADP-ribosyltransferase family protein [Rhizobium sp. MHM7A]|uniref:DarT ssDNA thymidine ADP-ribosyltransferase family protein n=1 Tax=Rhizobium sp. MHM7A TaxID=2583233 RepID=UPI001486843A|nr:DarT ssDNA thymidine ADP-ribosyltransferase family protein [Rhizobium sp. MHM7A]
MKDYQREIEKLARSKGIEKLYHFTPAVNAASILKNGLASQQLLQAHDIDFYAPDQYRFDDRLSALSLSIHSINEALLKKKIAEHGGDWIILEIEASILWTHSCRFCWTNAASSEVANYRPFLGGPWGFEEMFKDRPVSAIDLRSQRDTYGKRKNQPTDIQAEVQVFDPIDSDLIVDLTVKNPRVKREMEALMERIGERRPVVINEQIFW